MRRGALHKDGRTLVVVKDRGDCRIATKRKGDGPEQGRVHIEDNEMQEQGIDEKLLKQFKSWAKSLLKVNPSYVTDPGKLRSYVQGPNWNAPDCEYAHYKMRISLYGDELLGMFERLRAGSGEEGLAEYRSLLKAAGIEEDRS